MLQEAWVAHEPAAEEHSHRAPLEREEDPAQQMNTENKHNSKLIIQKNISAFRPLLNPEKQNTQAMHHQARPLSTNV
jgi:hypothetical protein